MGGRRVRAIWRSAGRAALVALVVLVWGTTAVPNAAAPAPSLTGYAADAAAQRAFTATRLAHYGGATGCATAPFVSYARSNVERQIVDAWYVALQAGADAALVGLGATTYRCEMDKALVYLERLW